MKIFLLLSIRMDLKYYFLLGEITIKTILYTGDIHDSKLSIDPYELCPCSSNKKFKFCCYQNSRKIKVKRDIKYSLSRMQHEIHESWKKANIKICLSGSPEDCTGFIKKAHSIQNNRYLSLISNNGHLYHITNDFTHEIPTATFKKISKNDASTFHGFCDYHDNILFKAIEQEKIIPNELQLLLFAYRAMSMEIHKYQRRLQMHVNQFIEDPSICLNKNFVYFYRKAKLDVEDAKKEMIDFNVSLINQNYDVLSTVYRKLDFQVSFATTTSFAVYEDLRGRVINEIYSSTKEILPSIYLTVVPEDGHTHIFISYLNKYKDVYEDYFNQLKELDKTELKNYLNFLIINYTENIFFSEKYVKSLTSDEKNSILNSFSSSILFSHKLELLMKGQYFQFDLFKELQL